MYALYLFKIAFFFSRKTHDPKAFTSTYMLK